MASVLKIKRSLNANAPGSLNTGELAVTFGLGAQNNSGDRVFVGGLGSGSDINGTSGAPIVIGGKYFTDMMDHVHGTLTANSAIITDSNNKVDNFKVDNLDLDGNTISSTNSNGDIILDPNGTGDVIIEAGAEFRVTDLTTGRVLFVGTNGALVDSSNLSFNNSTGALSVSGSFSSDNIKLDGNTISTINTNGNLDLNPNGTGQVKIADTWYLPRSAGTVNQVLTSDGTGNSTWASPVSTLNISADSGTDTEIDLLTETLDLEGDGVINTASDPVTNKITISVDVATTNDLGVASFDTNNFTVSTGAVSTKDITLGTSTLTNGSTTTAIAGLTQLDVDNLRLDGNTLSSTNTNGNIEITANGTGQVLIGTDKIVAGDLNTDFIFTTSGTGDLTLNTNNGTNSGYFKIADGTNGNIEISPNGTGHVIISGLDLASTTISSSATDSDITIAPNGTGNLNLQTDTIVAGDLNTDFTFTTSGTGDLTLNTNGGTNSGFIKINEGANGNIEISPNGTGQVIIGGQNFTAYNGDTWFVSADSGDDTNDGRRMNTAFATVKHALSVAATGDTVQILPGVYTEVFPLTVPTGVQVRGSGIRSTTITPTVLTNSLDCFLLNGETTVEELTIKDMFYNSGANTGYAFRFNTASLVSVTSRSPYVQRVTVFNKGSGANANDPYGFLSNNAGRGAYVDGSRITRASIESAMLFNEVTMIVPNSRALIMTNGARVEWLNCFTYFADLAIEGVVGAAGRGGDGKTRITFGGVTGAFQTGDLVTVDYGDSTDLTFTVDSVENSGTTVLVDGSYNSLEGKDFTPVSISGSVSGATATTIVRYDRAEFAAEMRAISGANVYGNQGVRADGDDVLIQLMAHNFAYIGTGADLTNNKSAVVQADEVIEANGGRVYYNSVDQSGNFRVGDYFSVDFSTGNVSFNAPEFTVESTNGFTFTSGVNVTQISANGVVANNITISGNTISSSTGPINIDPTGTQPVIIDANTSVNGVLTINNEFSFPTTDGVNGQALITDGNGNVSWTTISTTLGIAGDTGTDTIDLLTDTFTFTGTDPVQTNVTNNTVTISVDDASGSSKGIASFVASYFTVTNGDVAIDDATTTTKGIASFDTNNFTVTTGSVSSKSITLGTTTLDLGSTELTLAGLQQLDVDNIRIDGNEISSTDANGNISINPNGTGTVDVNNARITSLGTPTQGTDAATKDYVDAARSGLDVKQSVRAATTGPITRSNTQTIDNVPLQVGDRVLVKDQGTASENGVYVVANGAWSRATDFDEPFEVTAGVFFFIEEGDTNADNGFVITSNNPLVVGTDPLTFTQFSGAGQITAGDALTKTGNRLDVAVAASGGIEISADALQLKSSVAGNGLTYASGVIDVEGTTDRISVTADAIDIASTYAGQTSITTLGTIGTGTWEADTVAAGYGGTGFSTYSTGDLLYGNIGGTLSKLTMGLAGKFLQVNSAGNDLEYGDFDGGTF